MLTARIRGIAAKNRITGLAHWLQRYSLPCEPRKRTSMLPQELIRDLDRSSQTGRLVDDEETLIEDTRCRQSPSEQVEERLIRMMKSSTIPFSQVQHHRKPGPR
jgi:hypothetical protein